MTRLSAVASWPAKEGNAWAKVVAKKPARCSSTETLSIVVLLNLCTTAHAQPTPIARALDTALLKVFVQDTPVADRKLRISM